MMDPESSNLLWVLASSTGVCCLYCTTICTD